jgi:Na+-driven multidrug efflux pump
MSKPAEPLGVRVLLLQMLGHALLFAAQGTGGFAERALLAPDAAATAALGLGWTTFCLLQAFAVNLVSVCPLVVGRRAGDGDDGGARAAAGQALLLAAGGGVVGLALAAAGAGAAFAAGPARGAALFLATQGLALGPLLAAKALIGYFAGTMRVGLRVLAAAGAAPVAVHLALAWLLMGLLSWSVAGAGLARLGAALTAAAAALVVARAEFGGFAGAFRRPDRALLGAMLSEGCVLGLQQVAASLMVLLLYLTAARAGDVPSAALTLTHSGLYPLLFSFAWGSSQAVGAAAAQAVGRGDPRALARVTRLGLALSTVFAFFLPWGAFAACAEPTLAWLVGGGPARDAVLAASWRLMGLLGVFFVVDFAINFLSALLRAVNERAYLLKATAAAAAGFSLLLLALPARPGTTCLMAAFIAAQAAWAALLLRRVVSRWPGRPATLLPGSEGVGAGRRTGRADTPLAPGAGRLCLPDAPGAGADLPAPECALLRRLQCQALRYFLDNQTPGGLVLDRQRNHGPRHRHGLCSTAATGMGFIALALAAAPPYRLLTPQDAVRRIRTGLRAALGRLPHDHGVVPHFVDSASGAVRGTDYFSTVETSWLAAGALWAAAALRDAEVEALATQLYDRIDWHYWAGPEGAGAPGLLRHGKDRGGRFLPCRWDRLNGETAFMYVLAAGAAEGRRLPAASWRALGPHYGTVARLRFNNADLGLFVFQYGLDLLDLRRWKAPGAVDLRAEARVAALANQRACQEAATRFTTYRRFWGLSAGDGPGDFPELDTYRIYSPAGPVDGTAHLTASLASVAHLPGEVLRNVHEAEHDQRLRAWGRYGLSNVNLDRPWVGRDMVGIDAGAAVLALDNYLMADRVRAVFQGLPCVRRAMECLGFTPRTSRRPGRWTPGSRRPPAGPRDRGARVGAQEANQARVTGQGRRTG